MACVALAETAAHLTARLAPPPWPMLARLSVLAALLGILLDFRYTRPMARLRGLQRSAPDTGPLADREALRRNVPRDPVTGLPGPRFLEECWRREIGRADRYRHGLGVALLDMDGIGVRGCRNETLCAIGHALEVSLRPDEVACRLETGELVVVVPDVAQEALQRRLAGLASLAAAIALDRRDAAGAPLRVATGWSICPRDGRRLDEALRVARGRLRRARAAIHPGPDPGAALRPGRSAPH